MKRGQDNERPCEAPPQTGAQSRFARLSALVEARVEAHASRLLRGDRPWLVGFSHGSDSTALLAVLARAAGRPAWPRIHALHLDHRMRPGASATAARARRCARMLGVACDVEALELPRSETEARSSRYAAFTRHAQRLGAAALFLGHHRDDQCETLCLRLLRGTGPIGLAGIRELRPLGGLSDCSVFRPLLSIDKATIAAALATLGIGHDEDETNADPSLTPRNRVRHEILPRLRARDPRDEALMRLRAEALALGDAVRAEIGRTRWRRIAPGRLHIGLGRLAGLSPLARELCFERGLRTLAQAIPPRRHLARLVTLPELAPGRRVESRGRWSARRLPRGIALEVAGA